jgi:excisionase family DNA binding protein
MENRRVNGLLKPAEVAARLAVSRTWLYEAARSGRIPSIRIGGEDGPIRFFPEDVERWLDEARSSWLPGRGPVATQRSRRRERLEAVS